MTPACWNSSIASASALLKTERGTVLQVVRNPGWQLPYWSCLIVSVGMLMHFGVVLGSFLQKRGA